jgi:SseB protein N-terminal domain
VGVIARSRRAGRRRPVPGYSEPVSGPTIGTNRFGGDDGSAEPRAAAALAAFAAGQGSEHAAVQALTGTRLLVPVVAAAADQRTSEMSMPSLVGQDGRRAVPAFTSVDSLARWRPDARPVPADAGDVWRAAVADGCAVVVDIAGPVPLAIDGARLAALALGKPVPLPYQDPDVLAAVQAVAAGLPGVAGIGLADGAGGDAGPGGGDDRAGGVADGGAGGQPGVAHGGAGGSDLVVRVQLASGLSEAQARQSAGAVAEAVMARLGGRLRRGITVAVEAAH